MASGRLFKVPQFSSKCLYYKKLVTRHENNMGEGRSGLLKKLVRSAFLAVASESHIMVIHCKT